MKHTKINHSTTIKTFIFLILLSGVTISVYSQRTKSHYIDSDGKETFKSDAIYKRTVKKVNDIWEVQDYYLNDTLEMIGHFQDKFLKIKIDTFKYYHINGKLAKCCVYKDSLKNGILQVHNISGKIISQKNYTIDVPSGEWIWFDKNSNSNNIVINAAQQNVYSIENNAGYQGGSKALNAYIKSYRYPPQSSSDGFYGQTITTFNISETGELSDIDVILHGTEEMDIFVTDVINKMPNWIPARKNGKAVSTFYVLPLKFILNYNKVNISNRTKAKAFYVSGVKDYKNNKFKNAAFKFKNAISYDNTNAKYYYFYAVCLHQYEDPIITKEYFRIANMLDDQIVKQDIKENYKL